MRIVIENVYSELLLNDSFLLIHDVSERAISHRFGVYLERFFSKHKWNIDCEYNRDGLGGYPKTIKAIKAYKQKNKIETNVYPDIIIHKRGEMVGLVAIEFSKSSKSQLHVEFDKLKLKAYKEQLEYKYCFLITLPIKKRAKNIISVTDLIEEI